MIYLLNIDDRKYLVDGKIKNNVIKGSVVNGAWPVVINLTKKSVKVDEEDEKEWKVDSIIWVELAKNEDECNGDYNDIICEHWHKVKT